MSEEKVANKEPTLLRSVISLVCLFAADVQFLLSLKLIFIDKEFATLGLSLVLFLAFYLSFMVISQRMHFSKAVGAIACCGSAIVGLVGGLLIGLLGGLPAYAILIGVSSGLFGVFSFAISYLIYRLGQGLLIEE